MTHRSHRAPSEVLRIFFVTLVKTCTTRIIWSNKWVMRLHGSFKSKHPTAKTILWQTVCHHHLTLTPKKITFFSLFLTKQKKTQIPVKISPKTWKEKRKPLLQKKRKKRRYTHCSTIISSSSTLTINSQNVKKKKKEAKEKIGLKLRNETRQRRRRHSKHSALGERSGTSHDRPETHTTRYEYQLHARLFARQTVAAAYRRLRLWRRGTKMFSSRGCTRVVGESPPVNGIVLVLLLLLSYHIHGLLLLLLLLFLLLLAHILINIMRGDIIVIHLLFLQAQGF